MILKELSLICEVILIQKFIVQQDMRGFHVQDNTPVLVKIYSTLGRKFNKKDLEEAQRMGQELV